MHSYKETRLMPYKSELIKDIIMDIEKYPEFLPWCSKATILSNTKHYITAQLVVNFKGFSESYISKVELVEDCSLQYSIKTEAISGPFKCLKSIWLIKKENDSMSKVDFSIDFQFKSKILDMVVGMMFSIATEKIVTAFEKRISKISNLLV